MMGGRDAYGALELTVRTNGDEVIAALEDLGYAVVAPEDSSPLEEDYRRALEEIRDLGRFSSNAHEAAASRIAAAALGEREARDG